MEEYKRNCPKCGKLKIYKTKLAWKRAYDGNKMCMSCTKTGIKYTDEANKKKLDLVKITHFMVKPIQLLLNRRLVNL